MSQEYKPLTDKYLRRCNVYHTGKATAKEAATAEFDGQTEYYFSFDEVLSAIRGLQKEICTCWQNEMAGIPEGCEECEAIDQWFPALRDIPAKNGQNGGDQ